MLQFSFKLIFVPIIFNGLKQGEKLLKIINEFDENLSLDLKLIDLKLEKLKWKTFQRKF